MTRQAGINFVKALIRRFPQWAGMQDHRAMLNAMIRRVRNDNSRP